MNKVIQKTIKHDEAYLRQISEPVSFEDPNLAGDINLLKQFCKDNNNCLALAAVQIGVPKRIIYLKNTTLALYDKDKSYDEAKILINPKIISRKGAAKFWEACVSCLDYTGLVCRPYQMKIEYYDQKGNKHLKTLTGFESTVVAHEIDHLDGVLHIDIAEEILRMDKEERKIFRKDHPYVVISKTCDYKEPTPRSYKIWRA